MKIVIINGSARKGNTLTAINAFIKGALKALLESNEIIGKGEELERELKNILSQVDRISSKDKKRLIELGFISRENKHNKLYFHGDDRYMITLGKTPGDSRAAANAASIAINTIVC